MAARKTRAAVSDAADRLASLRAMRDLIARRLDDPDLPSREVAAMVGRMQAVLAEIADLEPANEDKGTPLDELRKRREARGLPTAGKPDAASK